jgi:threonine dehydratase
MNEKDLIDGVPVSGVDPDEVESAQKREVQRNLDIIESLDKISAPLDVKVYTGQSPWSYRNKAWRDMIITSDKEMKKKMIEYLKPEAK